MTKLFLIIVIALNVCLLHSQNLVLQSNKAKTKINYELRHPAHDVRAYSNELEVKIEYNKTTNTIINAIAQVPVKSFDSHNSNRDSHAMELIEAVKYPYARFRSTKIVDGGDSLTVYGNLTFHGVTKNITIIGSKKVWSNRLVVTGKFAISLDAFQVERPKLLFVPTEEYLRFEFTSEFTIN